MVLFVSSRLFRFYYFAIIPKGHVIDVMIACYLSDVLQTLSTTKRQRIPFTTERKAIIFLVSGCFALLLLKGR